MSETIKELLPYLQKIADKLESSANALWQLQMAQAKVVFITGIVQYVLWIAMVYGLYKVGRRVHGYYGGQWKAQNPEYKHIVSMDFNELYWYTVLSLVVSLLSYMCLPSINTMFTLLYNPEYWALHELLRMVK